MLYAIEIITERLSSHKHHTKNIMSSGLKSSNALCE